jgi:hypothetical protein
LHSHGGGEVEALAGAEAGSQSRGGGEVVALTAVPYHAGMNTDGWEPGGDPTGIGAGGRVLLAQQIWVRSWGPAGIGFLI